jgi:glutaredoxin
MHNDPKVPKMVDGKPALDGNGNQIMIPAPCPLCAKHKKLLARQDPSLKGIKKENMSAQQLEIKAKNDKCACWNRIT